MAKQKKKRNKKFQTTTQVRAQPGVLRKAFEVKQDDDFIHRYLFGLGGIRSFVYKNKDLATYDSSFHRCFQNLVEMKLAKEKVEELINKHIEVIRKKEDGIYHGNQIDINNPIDDELNLLFKDFFIRGSMAIDGVKKRAEFMELKIDFLFSEQDKSFEKGTKKFPLDESDDRFKTLLEFVKNHKKGWYSDFREFRRKIEHEGWSLEKINYRLGQKNKVEVIIPKIDNKEMIGFLNNLWDTMNFFCEEIITFLLGLKLDDKNLFIMFIQKEKRNPDLPIKYVVSHKSFPGIPITN